ncbi:MAG: hypothetical protein M3Q65_12700 [Chloroflexota bacterium]|nr:hypothetical protein [Chloroflexota bacterium]
MRVHEVADLPADGHLSVVEGGRVAGDLRHAHGGRRPWPTAAVERGGDQQREQR